MTGLSLPIVWHLGAPGVGKSTLAYRVMVEVSKAGKLAAFVDADQLRLASRASASETELIATGLFALERGYRLNGAKVMVVAGLVQNEYHLKSLLPGVPRSRVLALHLMASPDTIRERIKRRGWGIGLADDAIRYADEIDAGFADQRIDTTALSPDLLSEMIGTAVAEDIGRMAPASEIATSPAMRDPVGPKRVVLVTGPGGAGASTVGYQVFSILAKAGDRVGYLDAHQFGLLGGNSSLANLSPMRATNTFAVAGSLADGGSETIVISGDAPTIGLLNGAWGSSDIHSVWLHASAAALAERITCRAQGKGPPIQGDDRDGLAGPTLRMAIAEAINESENGSLRPEGAFVIDTSDLSPEQVANRIISTLPMR